MSERGTKTYPVLPAKVGRYEILSALGRGGMAAVYRARDPDFDREVAVKVLPRELLHDLSFQARFKREARLIARMEHPAIVPVYDFGEEDGQPYIVMRLMRGGSLADRLRNGALPLAEAARILSALAPALDRAHTHGILHRDLKPSNILFDEEGQPYVADFGIARFMGETTRLTGGLVGTPAYMSPEQASGEGHLDARSDLYSLGVIVFQMLTGKLPYEADTPVGMAMKHVNAALPRIRDLRPDLPQPMEDVIRRALAKNPSSRYPSARHFAEDVVTLPSRLRPAQPSGPRPTPVWEVLRAHAGLAGAALVLAGLAGGLIVLAVLGVVVSRLVASAAVSPSPEATRTSPAVTRGPTQVTAAVSVSVTSAVTPTQEASATPSLTPTPENTPTPAGPPPIGPENIAALELVTSLTLEIGMHSVAFSADGHVLAAGSNDGLIRLWDVVTGQALAVLEGHSGLVRHLSFSSDGYTLASAGYDSTVRLWDYESGTLLHVLEGHTSEVRSVSFSPDGQTLATAGGDVNIRLWDVGTGELVRELDRVHAGVVRAVFSPDGQTLASGSYDMTLWLWDAAEWQPGRTLEGQTAAIRYLAFSPDSRLLAAGTDAGLVHLWEVDSGEEVRVLQGHTGSVLCVAFSPDSRTLASAGLDGSVQLWEVASGQSLRVMAENTERVLSVAFSPAGGWLASAGDDAILRLWAVPMP